MGLFDNLKAQAAQLAKDAGQQALAAAAEAKANADAAKAEKKAAAEARGRKVAAFEADKQKFTLYEHAIDKDGEEQPLTDVTARLEAGEELQSRVTATRLVLLGVFALAAKKKSGGTKFLTIEGPEFMWGAEVDRKSIKDAQKFTLAVNNQVKKNY